MKLFRAVVREIPENLNSLLWMNLLSAVAMTAFVGLVSTAVQEAATGRISARLLLMFAITVMLFHITHVYTLVTASQDTERLIHKLRVRLFDLVRRADLVTVERIGHASLQGALTQDTQILSQVLPILVLGFQQAVMLLFLAAYLAWLSPLACLLAFGLAGLAVVVRFRRVKQLRKFMQSAASAEERVFNGLTELLQGFKEIRMSGPRAAGVTGVLAEASRESRTANALLKAQWGRNFAVIESMLYSLVGLMVFVVPLLAAGYHEVILPATLAVMFISGPVYTVSVVTPFVTQAELALENIEKMQETLGPAAEAAASETACTLGKDPASIALAGAALTYRDTGGSALFTVGPIAAEFHAGQITFITGGNGSGKSTLLRLLTGLIPLDAGRLLADDAPLATDQMQDYRDRISAIFSDYHLSRRLYCIDNPDPARIRGLLERLDLQSKVTVRDNTFSTIDLSSGQRKRLAFVVAELEDKPIIVLDEWAADQDPHFRRIFYEELLPDLKARGKIVICVTHDERWFPMADRIYRMEEGRIEAVRA
ncbi:MAG: cyclic peptide export ABC transporter [Deltaproteobacteria bacterium]|nr:cyclic peptide export ABC transporter [Deltaproteobacteria bacterium]